MFFGTKGNQLEAKRTKRVNQEKTEKTAFIREVKRKKGQDTIILSGGRSIYSSKKRNNTGEPLG